MKLQRATRTAGALVLLQSAACAGTGEPRDDRHHPSPTRNAIVLTGEQLHQRSTDLLGMLSSRIGNLTVGRSGDCPEISIRGRKTIARVSDPGIYVDGQRAADTCILTMLSPSDIELIEVYPMGVTSRPGYAMDGAGLILVFTRRADR